MNSIGNYVLRCEEDIDVMHNDGKDSLLILFRMYKWTLISVSGGRDFMNGGG